ncbi:MAG: 2OG-Fe(II) oxygenase, partial [Parvibaculum sp.]
MSLLDIDMLRATPLKTDPYEYFVVPNFIRASEFDKVVSDFPPIASTGSIPPSELDIKGAFEQLLDELEGPAFREAIEEKFGLDLSSNPTMITVRGNCSRNNGKIHTDTESKIITVLLYMNQEWD